MLEAANILSHDSLGTGRPSNKPIVWGQCLVDPQLLLSIPFPSSPGTWHTSDFQQGICFPQDGPQRTKDSALSAELQQALAVVEDLIKSCELAEGLAAVTGCPVCSVAGIGTWLRRGGTVPS